MIYPVRSLPFRTIGHDGQPGLANATDLHRAIGFGRLTGRSMVLGETRASFQAEKENVTFAPPRPASSGTRTGP